MKTIKTINGMKLSIVQPYDFADIAWYATMTRADPTALKWEYLMTRLTQVGADYYVRDKALERWTKHPDRASATRTVYQQYGGSLTIAGIPMLMTHDDIKVFVSAGIVTLARTIHAPGGGDFVVFRGEKCLNTYKDERLAGDPAHVLAAEPFLRVVYGSLCNQEGEPALDVMFDEIEGAHVTPFKWVMHWLAARYQMPGFAPMTNLWFIGKQRGTGKGTLVDAMRGVLGSTAVGKANQADISKGWTNSLQGHELIEWDEFKSPGGWREFGNLLKEMTGNKTFAVNARNIGGSIHPNTSMHIFTTNEERPILVEANDRQNTFIETTSDVAWREKSTALWNPVTSEWADPKFLTGFAALLNAIDVDVGLISRPLKTTKFEELAGGASDPVEQWVEEGGADAARGAYVPWDELHLQFKGWVRDHLHMKPDDFKEFKRKMIRAGFATCAPRKVPDGRGGRKSVRCAVMTLPPVVEAEEGCSSSPILQFPGVRQ